MAMGEQFNGNLIDLSLDFEMTIDGALSSFGLLFQSVNVETLLVQGISVYGSYELTCYSGFLIYKLKGGSPIFTNI